MTARPTVRIRAATTPPRAHSQRAPKARSAPTVRPTPMRSQNGQPKGKGKIQVEIVVADLTKDPRSDADD
jgi:hypothetical protein